MFSRDWSFLMKPFLLILFTLLLLPLPVQANLCETRAFSSIVGVESYPLALLRETKFLLNREITPAEISAIEQANHLKKDEDSSQLEWVHLRAKVQILKKAGFSQLEVRKLIENGIVWIRSLSAEEALLQALEDKEDIYFSSGFLILDKPYRIHKVVRETPESFEVLAEAPVEKGFLQKVFLQKGFLNMGTITIPKKPGDELSFFAIHSDHQVLFSVSKIEKPKISREAIKLPPPTREEAELKEKGFGPAWTRGLDKLNEWVAVRRQLQELKANPRTTHIPYFADQISAHLDFAKEGLGASISQQKEIGLANLVRTAKKAILEEKVTYEWWLQFNYQISALLSGEKESNRLLRRKDGLIMYHITRTLDQFPLQMAVPTIYGEIGIITFNRAQSEGIYPLGLISQPKEVDFIVSSPLKFIMHDMGHMERSTSEVIQQYSTGHKLKHKKMLELIENRPTEKRKQAELVYFALTHESDLTNILFKNQPREETVYGIANHFKGLLDRKVIPLRMAGLGKEYSDLKSKEAQVQYIREHIAEPFMQEVYDPVFP